MLPTKFRVNWPSGVGGFEIKLLTPWDDGPITIAHIEHVVLG